MMDSQLKFKELNSLIAAAECGDSIAVNLCLKSGLNVNEKMNGQTAADLAWNNQHFEVVLNLLKANSQFPKDFKAEMATEEIKKILDVTNKLHELILKGNTSEVGTILQDNPDLRHFYSFKNVSASAFALRNRKFKVYEFLIANNVFIGPNENVYEIYKELSKSRCKDIKKIHLKYLKSFKDSHLIILVLNSSIASESEDTAIKFELIRNAYKFLDQIDPFMSLILQIVAASRDFKVIFDFDSSVPEVKVNIEHGKVREIRIPAHGLLDPAIELGVYESIAREFCIFAMELVYKNHGRPYSGTDDQTRKIFNKISTICEASRGKEELIDSLYSNKADVYHAKLMALVPQMMVKYIKDPVGMEECRANFSELFKFCQEVIEPEMQHKLPTIKSSVEQIAQKFKVINQSQRKLLLALVLVIPFAIWLTLLLTKPYIEPIYSCRNLTHELRSKIFESTVEFQGVNVIFGDLFGRNMTSCEHLSPQEITRMLKVFDSGKVVENYTGIYVNFTADENARIIEKVPDILTRSPNSSYASWTHVGYTDLMEKNRDQATYEDENQDIDENIYIKYMKVKFREPALQVHKKAPIRTKFYVERIIGKFSITSEQLNCFPNGFNELSKTKLFILSDKGGSGKSTYFRHMAWKLKRRFPLKWISYVDLKQHIHVLQDVPKTDANLTTVVELLSSKFLNLTSQLEIGVFSRTFLANESMFLWDGVDEVSPVYTDEILRLIWIVKRLTDNRQWVATRPHLEMKIGEKFKIEPLQLSEYDENDKLEFVTKFMDAEGIKNLNISKVFKDINTVLIRTQRRDNNEKFWLDYKTNPQILQIMCESYAKNLQLTDKTNLYTIYESYISKRFEEVVMDKGDIAKEDFFKVTELGLFRKIHQHHAIAPIIQHIYAMEISNDNKPLCQDLEINKSYKDIKDEEVLRFGIVYKQNDRMTFEHATFKEFFIAQYFLNNIWELTDGSPRDEEASLRLKFLIYAFYKSCNSFKIVCDFIAGFIDAYSSKSSRPFDAVLKTIFLRDHSGLLNFLGNMYDGIDLATKFFKKDHYVISVLWKVNQNRTFFHEFFEATTTDDDVAVMKKIVDDNFSLEDRKKILEGKHQAANFLRMSWQKCRNRNSTAAFMNAVNFKFDIERLRKVTKFEKFMELVEAQNYTSEELWEFFSVSHNTRVIKSINEEKILTKYAQKLLSDGNFDLVSKIWNIGLEEGS